MAEDLARGAEGKAVRDLQTRLARLGFPLEISASFDEATEHAVQAFQSERGLRETGHVEPETWQALAEAGYALGDRLLYHRRPMLRGDDVAEVQRRCNALGFDAGREDGIFGPASERAIREFQLNAGLASDGVVGPETRLALERLGSRAAGAVAGVREREELRTSRQTLNGCRMFIAVAPGMDVLGEVLVRELAEAQAQPLVDRSGADASALAATANDFDAQVAIAFQYGHASAPRCAYFANQRYRSERGHAVATAIDSELTAVLGPASGVEGRTFTFLRETRMAAVVVEPVMLTDVAGMRQLVARVDDVSTAVVRGVRRGLEAPDDAEHSDT